MAPAAFLASELAALLARLAAWSAIISAAQSGLFPFLSSPAKLSFTFGAYRLGSIGALLKLLLLLLLVPLLLRRPATCFSQPRAHNAELSPPLRPPD